MLTGLAKISEKPMAEIWSDCRFPRYQIWPGQPKWQIWKIMKSGSKAYGEKRCYTSFGWVPDSLQLARSKSFSFLWGKVLGLAQMNGWLWQIKAIHPNAPLIRRGQVTLEWTAGVSGEGSMNSKEEEIPASWSSSAPIWGPIDLNCTQCPQHFTPTFGGKFGSVVGNRVFLASSHSISDLNLPNRLTLPY